MLYIDTKKRKKKKNCQIESLEPIFNLDVDTTFSSDKFDREFCGVLHFSELSQNYCRFEICMALKEGTRWVCGDSYGELAFFFAQLRGGNRYQMVDTCVQI